MPITIKTRSQLTTAIRAFFTVLFSTRNLGTESFLGKTWRALAMAIWAFQKAVQDADYDATPTANTSSAGLDNWATVLALPNGQGGYGRKVAHAATGGVVLATGTPATAIANGASAVGSDGSTYFVVVNGPYAVGGGGTVSVDINATTAGTAGNLASGELVTWVSPPAGLASSASVTSALAGGYDLESNTDILGRIQYRLRNPPRGGVAADYRWWCENAVNLTTGASVPIARAYVYPKRHGTGTVDMTITQAGDDRDPGSTKETLVQAYINSVRPVTVEAANVYRPYQPAGAKLTIRARVTPALARYAFDWNDLAAAYPTVKSYPTTHSVQVNGSLPAALIAAIDAYTGGTAAAPRIQIAGTGANAPAKAQSLYVIAWVNAADDVLTLAADVAIVGTAVNGDVIYAGGPVVDGAQDNIIGYVNALGPSRMSGFADPLDPWEDTASIARVGQSAIDTFDADGTRMISNTVAAGVTINGATNDVEASDIAPNPPMLLLPVLVTVTA